MTKKIILRAEYSADDRPLEIGEFKLPCYVLSNGQRVLSQGGMLKALGLSSGSAGGKGGDRLAKFVGGQRVSKFINNDLIPMIEKPIEFKTKSGSIANGYDAEILQQIVRGVAKAYLSGKLQKQQQHIGENAEKLDDAFSKIGLIALIDEATGYQYDRERKELQKILKAYISEELLPWEKRFPDEFYMEIFRLNGWPYTVSQIKKAERPSIIGKWTKKYIYSVLPQGVLHALLEITPRNEDGRLKHKLHQRLTREQGIEHLNKQIVSTVTLMNISNNWNEFERYWNKKFGQQEIPFNYEIITPKKDLSDFNKYLKEAIDNTKGE